MRYMKQLSEKVKKHENTRAHMDNSVKLAILGRVDDGHRIAVRKHNEEVDKNRTTLLDQVVAHRLPRASTIWWNFHSCAVNTVYKHKDDLLTCFQTIRDSRNFDHPTVREAGGFVRMLEDEAFCFFLALFYKIMENVDMIFSQLQKRNIDPVFIKALVQSFTDSMLTIRASIPSLCGDSASDEQQQPIKRRRMLGPGEQQRLVTEVCDTILIHAKERFSFTQHLISTTLLHGELFPQHSVKLPDTALETTVEAYPMLNKAKLKTELSLIYENSECKACSGAVPLYQFFMENNLQSTFTDCQPPQDAHHHTHDNSRVRKENEVEELEQTTMAIFITGKEDPLHPPKNIKIVIEGTEVLNELPSFATAFAMVFGLIYTVNIKYQKRLQFTFEFVQKVLMELDGKKMTPSTQLYSTE
ncbi:uncharacterized protein LOC114555277 [Perca flavescens]|uniref:uncharacterized protein LOC114555277 n=1 Tax=Perca flavescens TaxID=8167 RepID=UPI00106DD403|nr:uncharacterized protein LOC114555277 [Perca flavescens]